ncbi:spore cortex biosynthesis protein YabQ [Brotaphodocola sp.]|uniref:spore cortex biosynthesis protein YabQ n=1 Tax=Brotaphodocola sp. TaxID=3073577 RepID=UPI003D7DFCB6
MIWGRIAGQIRVITVPGLFELSGMSGTRFSEAVFHEAHACWRSLAVGIVLMMIYDIFRLFRLLVKHSAWMIGVEDVIYWVFASFTVFGLFYLENDGALRFYMIGVVILGMILYDRIVSTNFFRVLKKAGRCFRIKIRKKTQKQSR